MGLFKSTDERLREHGFNKIREGWFGVEYRKVNTALGYVQRLDIKHVHTGKHVIRSYQEATNREGDNNVVGLSYNETKLALKKMKELKLT